MNHEIPFGEYITQKRKERRVSSRELAIAAGISPMYMCDIEKGRKFQVSDEFLEKICRFLELSEAETDKLYDLSAIAKNTVSADLPEYIMKNNIVRLALRTAKKNNIPDEKWERFITQITDKEKREE